MSGIEWTDRTWNPVRGCTRVSEGCRNCYAERMAARSLPGLASPTTGEPFATMTKGGPRWTGTVEFLPHKLAEPLGWRKPCRVFVNSMSDLLHESLSFEQIAAVYDVMSACPHLTFQVLTKRPERAVEFYRWMAEAVTDGIADLCHIAALYPVAPKTASWPPPNVWLGVSVEDQATKHRIDTLRETAAAVRFLSLEPLLEDLGELDLSGISWAIIGGESGPGARPLDVEWVRSVIRQCREAGVPVFVKQLGARPYTTTRSDGGRPLMRSPSGIWFPAQVSMATPERWSVDLRDRKGGDPAEWPEDLRVREFPASI